MKANLNLIATIYYVFPLLSPPNLLSPSLPHPSVLVLYCCVMNEQKLNGAFINPQFLELRSLGTAYLGHLLRVSQDCNQGFGWAPVSSEGSAGAESASKLIQIVGGIQSLATVGLRPFFLDTWPLYLQSQEWEVVSLSCFRFL